MDGIQLCKVGAYEVPDETVSLLASLSIDASSLPHCDASRNLSEEETHDLSTDSLIMNIAGVCICMMTAAMAAGLTMGLLSIDPLEMAIKIKSGTPKEQKQAKSILPLIQNHHLMLVTLLLYNAAANEALPLFLDKLVPSYIAILLSVTIVLFFGEIIPSAIFTGPSQLTIAYNLSAFVKLIMAIAAPIAYPIARCLDWVLGHDGHGVTKFNRKELQALVQIQYEEGMRGRKHSETMSPVSYDQVSMISGALDMTSRTAQECMTKRKAVFAVSESSVLDEDAIADMYNYGHSRILVYEDNRKDKNDQGKLKGYMLLKQLVVIDPQLRRPVKTLPLHKPRCVEPGIILADLLNLFQQGGKGLRGGHLALVCTKPDIAQAALDTDKAVPKEAGFVGIITLEDVIEELLQEEIYDETDKFEIMAMTRAKKVIRKWKKHVAKKKIKRGEEADESALDFKDVVDATPKGAKGKTGRFDGGEDDSAEKGEAGADAPLIQKPPVRRKKSWYGGSS